MFFRVLILFMLIVTAHFKQLDKKPVGVGTLLSKIGAIILKDENKLVSNIEDGIKEGIKNNRKQGEIIKYFPISQLTFNICRFRRVTGSVYQNS